MPQDHRIVVFLVTRTEDQRDPPLPGEPKQLVELLGMMLELGRVAPSELVPETDIVSEPSSQFCAGRDITEPMIDGRLLLCDTPRPQPIDEDARAVGRRRRLVRPLEFDVELRG